jgi:predicted Rossmann-fold nucleotide-binding protein
MPVVLIGRDFWSRAIDFNFLVEEGVIDQDDITLFQIADCSEQAIQIVYKFYGGRPPE